MNDDDTNPLAGLDLDAWAAPPPPAGLADRAIARVAATDQAIAVVQRRRSVKRRWWFAGGVAAALAASAVAFVAIPHGSPDPTGNGALVATAPQQLSVGGATATLDPGADVSWQHAGDAVHVAQRTGSATWKVERDQQLSLDIGAAVASIDASNATFRVETRMNLTDTRIVGVTAATAAAVALVTVYVYEGHVNVSGAGQAIVVERGVTVEIKPGDPPRKLDNVAGVPVVTAVLPELRTPPPPAGEIEPELIVPIGEKIVIHDPRGEIRVAIDPKCPGQDKLMWPRGSAGAMGVSEASFAFTCNGIDKHGAIKVVKDAGFGVVMSPTDGTVGDDRVHVMGAAVPPRRQVTVNGAPVATEPGKPWATVQPFRTVFAIRLDGGVDDIHYYIRRLIEPGKPMVEVAVAVGDNPTIHDPSGRPRVILIPRCTGESKLSLLGGDAISALPVGVHPYSETCVPEGNRFTGKITVVQDDGSALAKVDPLADWLPPLAVSGSYAVPGTTVEIEDVRAQTIDGRFTIADVRTAFPGVVAVHLDVPGKGKHVIVARKGSWPSGLMLEHDKGIELVFKAANPTLLDCVKRHGPGQSLSMWIATDGVPYDITAGVDDAASESCLVEAATKLRFPRQPKPHFVSFGLDPGCDAKALVDAGEKQIAQGAYAAALVKLDAAIDCDYSTRALQLGFLAACDAHNVKFARKYWNRFHSTEKAQVLQLCVRNGIGEDQLTE